MLISFIFPWNLQKTPGEVILHQDASQTVENIFSVLIDMMHLSCKLLIAKAVWRWNGIKPCPHSTEGKPRLVSELFDWFKENDFCCLQHLLVLPSFFYLCWSHATLLCPDWSHWSQPPKRSHPLTPLSLPASPPASPSALGPVASEDTSPSARQRQWIG